MIFERDSIGRVTGYSGLVFVILDQISGKLNFTYIVKEPADGLWGTKVGGEWNGLIRYH